MAVETNGWPIETTKMNGRSNGKAIAKRRSTKRPPPNTVRWSFNIMARLGAWYLILTALLRCPSSTTYLTEDSPIVCKPYLKGRSYITPHLKPYYDAYASSSVERARPYAEDLYRRVYAPSLSFSQQTYETYGAPRVNEISKYTHDQWERTLKPKIEAAQVQGRKQYDSTLAPQVGKVSAATLPYYKAGRERVLVIYHTQLLPAYSASLPYAEKLIALGHKIAVEIGLPYVQSAWRYTVVFVERTVWPKVTILYGKNVEPQLVRIGERLGRYRDGSRLKAVVEEIDSSSQSSSVSSRLSSVSSSIASVYIADPSSSVSGTKPSAATASSSLTPDQEAQLTREKVESDLKNWQDKFAKAADKGKEDLEERVKKITEHQVQSQVSTLGESLVVQLEESSISELAKLKNSIKKIVKSFSDEKSGTDSERAEEQLSKATRGAGLAVKSKAQALRSWKQSAEQETQSLVNAASESTLEVIDNIRDLGLQEIGMRWAWMEGISYKDWANYHILKKTFDEWRQEVEAVARNHEGLQKLTYAASEVESRGMLIAEQTAKELARLKEVGKWKIQAADASNDFSTKHIPAAAAVAGQKVVEKARSASEQIIGKPQGSLESVLSDASKTAATAASSASSAIIGTELGVMKQASSKISDAVSGSQKPNAESVISAAKKKTEWAASVASEAVVGTPAPVYQSIASKASDAVYGSSTSLPKKVSSEASSAAAQASSIASKASKKVFAGAMAQEVGNQKPILDDLISDDDDEITYSESLYNIVSKAGNKYSDVTRAVSEALLKPANTQGSIEGVASIADEQYTSALAAASSVLYGTQQGAVESVTIMASGKYADAVAAASSIIYGPPTPVTQAAAKTASSLYFEATRQAQLQYSRAKLLASQQVSGSPKSIHQEIQSSIEKAYSRSLAAASQKLQDALSSASTAVYGKPPNPQQSILSAADENYSAAISAASSRYESAKRVIGGTSKPGYETQLAEAARRYSDLTNAANSKLESATSAVKGGYIAPGQSVLQSISSIASARLADSLSIASAQYSSVKTAVGATPTPVHQQYLLEGQRRYYEAIGLAHERYSEFLIAASSAVYGTPTPAYESLYSVASKSLYGTPTPAYESFLNVAQTKFNSLVSRASDNLQKAQASASAIAGKASKAGILDSASSQYSSALSVASASLSSASAAASTGLYGTPTPAYESFLNAAQSKYSDVISQASENLQKALASASSAGGQASNSGIGESASSRYSSALSVASASLSSASAAASTSLYGTPTPAYQSLLNAAQSQYSVVISRASENLQKGLGSASSVEGKASKSGILDSASSRYSSALSAASGSLSSASAAARAAVHGTQIPTPAYQSFLNAAQSQYGDVVSQASENLQKALGSADGKASQSGFLDSASSRYSSALSVASASLSSASAAASVGIYGTPIGKVEYLSSVLSEQAKSISSKASTAVIGTETPWTESVASQASQNWEALVSKASEQVYGSPTPFAESVYSQAGEYAAQATGAAAAQYEAVQALFAELMKGKEPAFTESAVKRLGSIFYTGYHASIASSASSYASDAYASASSVVSSVFTPPATLELIISAANEQVNAAVEAASLHYYGSSKGSYERATSTAASAYSSIRSAASEKIYGTQPDFLASVGSSFDDVANSARDAISAAIYGTTTPVTASITSAAANAYASVSSIVGKNVAAGGSVVDTTRAKISEAVYGPEQRAIESASSRLADIVESARARLAQFPEGASEALDAAKSGVENIASSVSSVAAAATDKVKTKDEL